MPRYHTRNRLITGIPITDSDADVITYAKSLSTPGMVDNHLDRPHRDKFARLPRPWKVALRIATEATGKDVLKCSTLLGPSRQRRGTAPTSTGSPARRRCSGTPEQPEGPRGRRRPRRPDQSARTGPPCRHRESSAHPRPHQPDGTDRSRRNYTTQSTYHRSANSSHQVPEHRR